MWDSIPWLSKRQHYYLIDIWGLFCNRNNIFENLPFAIILFANYFSYGACTFKQQKVSLTAPEKGGYKTIQETKGWLLGFGSLNRYYWVYGETRVSKLKWKNQRVEKGICCLVFLFRRTDNLSLKSKLGEKIHKDMSVGELLLVF